MQNMTGYFGTTTEVSKRQLKPKCRTVLPYGQLQQRTRCVSANFVAHAAHTTLQMKNEVRWTNL